MKFCEKFSTKKLLKECEAEFESLRNMVENKVLSADVLDFTTQAEEDLQEKIYLLKHLSKKYDFELPSLIPEAEDYLEHLEEVRILHGLLFVATLRYRPAPLMNQ